jgi:hypothetical protein
LLDDFEVEAFEDVDYAAEFELLARAFSDFRFPAFVSGGGSLFAGGHGCHSRGLGVHSLSRSFSLCSLTPGSHRARSGIVPELNDLAGAFVSHRRTIRISYSCRAEIE